ncbi:MAG: hypothetical protein RMK18_11680 [Armatimonadota bacterium]|nr:hypothetical protein [Armatimonadota bacterium]
MGGWIGGICSKTLSEDMLPSRVVTKKPPMTLSRKLFGTLSKLRTRKPITTPMRLVRTMAKKPLLGLSLLRLMTMPMTMPCSKPNRRTSKKFLRMMLRTQNKALYRTPPTPK